MIKIPNKDYEIGKYLVTIAEYMHFAKNNEKHLPEWKEKLGRYEKMNLTDNAPIIGVSWHDAVAYCKWLNEQQKEYVYRLPTEEEWEYACRAGTTTKWSFGDDEKELDKYAWYNKNSYDLGEKHKDYGTHVVGEKLPNPWGLFDMHGNVLEWCEDWYDKGEDAKVLRGGSWNSSSDNSRSAVRDRSNPSNRGDDVGFRLLRTLP
jgi:formylglycine-generating enzyme required for sulfatase activity